MAFQSGANGQSGPGPVAAVRDILSLPDDRLDYGRAKLTFDRIVDPSINVDATMAEIDRLAGRASALAGPNASPAAKLSALRRVIYESGDWNGGRPFSYDHADPLRQRYLWLAEGNRRAFQAAEALGWEPPTPTLE